MLICHCFKGALVSLALFILEALAGVWVASKLDKLILDSLQLSLHYLERLKLPEL